MFHMGYSLVVKGAQMNGAGIILMAHAPLLPEH